MTITDAIIDRLKDEEGFVPHAYQDHLGFWTIGHGILIDERKGCGITADESEALLRNRVERYAAELDADLPWLHNSACRDAVILMAYQMGVRGLLGFGKMLAAMEAGDRAKAADEALDSRWAHQTPARAERVAAMIRGAS